MSDRCAKTGVLDIDGGLHDISCALPAGHELPHQARVVWENFQFTTLSEFDTNPIGDAAERIQRL